LLSIEEQNVIDWKRIRHERQDDKSGHLSFQDMHKGCIKGQPQTYQQLVDIEELIMAICSQAHMKTLVKTMHSTLKLATMVAWA
jgi:hypothetical protein